MAELPVATVPKPRLAGLALNWPDFVADPIPLNETVNVGLTGSLLVMPILPATLPAVVGEKVTTAWAD